MPTIKDHVYQVVKDNAAPLAPADIFAELERRGVETTTGYVGQALQRLKEEERLDQPRDGRWGIPGRSYEGAGGATVHAEPGRTFAFEPSAPGVVVVRIGNAVLQLSLHQTGPELVIPIESFVGEGAS